jgi:hypothetical protein
MAMPFKGTWCVPEDSVKSKVTIDSLFPRPYDPVTAMVESTGCIVVRGSDRHSLHFGASLEEHVKRAKKKMDTILRYYVSSLLIIDIVASDILVGTSIADR